MKYGIVKRAALLATMVATVACGPAPTTPTAPTVASLAPLLLPRVGGLWAGPWAFDHISGGTGIVASAGTLECAGITFAAVLGQSNDSTLDITQDGDKVDARLRSAETGLACSYTGSIGTNGGMVLDATSCWEEPLVLRCLPDANGNVGVRTLSLVGSTLTASLNAPVQVTNVTGVAAHTYNVFDGNGAAGGLVARHTFNLTRR